MWPSCGKIMDAYLLLKSVTTSAVTLTSAVSTSMVTLTAEAPPTATAHATAALETPTRRLVGAVEVVVPELLYQEASSAPCVALMRNDGIVTAAFG